MSVHHPIAGLAGAIAAQAQTENQPVTVASNHLEIPLVTPDQAVAYFASRKVAPSDAPPLVADSMIPFSHFRLLQSLVVLCRRRRRHHQVATRGPRCAQSGPQSRRGCACKSGRGTCRECHPSFAEQQRIHSRGAAEARKLMNRRGDPIRSVMASRSTIHTRNRTCVKSYSPYVYFC